MLLWSVLVWCSWGWSAGTGAGEVWDAKVCNGTDCFNVQIASTTEQLQQWLMWVEEMADDAWMLFVFQNPWIHEFWMKNTLIPLDMIWLNEEGEVLYVKEYAPPCSPEDSVANNCQLFGPPEGTLASYVLEVNANKTREVGIYEGVKLDLYNVK